MNSAEDLTGDNIKVKRGVKAEREDYKEACKKLGVVPNSKVLHALGQTSLDLTVCKRIQ